MTNYENAGQNPGQSPNVPFFLPSIGTEEEQAVLRVMRSGRLTTFKKHCGLNARNFPHAQKLYETTLSLPLWPDMDDEMIERGIKTVTEIGKNNYEN